jgi:hypothetical protein
MLRWRGFNIWKILRVLYFATTIGNLSRGVLCLQKRARGLPQITQIKGGVRGLAI